MVPRSLQVSSAWLVVRDGGGDVVSLSARCSRLERRARSGAMQLRVAKARLREVLAGHVDDAVAAGDVAGACDALAGRLALGEDGFFPSRPARGSVRSVWTLAEGSGEGPDVLDALEADWERLEPAARWDGPRAMSAACRRRFHESLYLHWPSLERPGWLPMYVVFTPGDDFPLDYAAWERWWRAMRQWLDRRFGPESWVMLRKLAFQRRGASHWDVILSVRGLDAADVARFRDELAARWVAVSGLHGSTRRDRLREGVFLTAHGDDADWSSVRGYMLRDVAKSEQNVAPRGVDVARWWSWSGAPRLSLAPHLCGHVRCSAAGRETGSARVEYRVDCADDRLDDIRRTCLAHWWPRAHPVTGEDVFLMPSRLTGRWAQYVAGEWGDPAELALWWWSLQQRRSSRPGRAPPVSAPAGRAAPAAPGVAASPRASL